MQQQQAYTDDVENVNAHRHGIQRGKHICTIRTSGGPVRVSGKFSEVMNLVRAALAARTQKTAQTPIKAVQL